MSEWIHPRHFGTLARTQPVGVNEYKTGVTVHGQVAATGVDFILAVIVPPEGHGQRASARSYR